MIVYLDLVFILNSFINFILLFSLEKMFSDSFSYKKIILSSLLGGGIVAASFYSTIFFKIFKIIGGIVIVLFGIKKNTINKILIKIFTFYTENLALVGVLASFKINTCLLLFFATTLILGLMFFEKFRKQYIFHENFKYNVIVTQKDNVIKIQGFFDSGNFSSSENGIPLVFINKKYFNISFNNYVLVKVKGIINEEIKKAYVVDKFEVIINKKRVEKKVLIVFSEISEDCLLNSLIMI